MAIGLVYIDPVTGEKVSGSFSDQKAFSLKVAAAEQRSLAAQQVVAQQQAAGGFVQAGGAYVQPYSDSQTNAKNVILARKGSTPFGGINNTSNSVVNTGNAVDDLFNWFNTPFFRDRQFSSATANADGTGTNYQNANFVQIMNDNSGAYAATGGRSGSSRQYYIQTVGNSLQDLTIAMFNNKVIDQQKADYILDTFSNGNNIERFINNWNNQPQLQQNTLKGSLDAYTRNQLLTLYSQELYGATDTGQQAPTFPVNFK